MLPGRPRPHRCLRQGGHRSRRAYRVLDEQAGRHLPRARVRAPPACRDRRRRLQPGVRPRHRSRPQRRPRLPVRDAAHPAGDDPHAVRDHPLCRRPVPRRPRPRHNPGTDRLLRRPRPCGPVIGGVLRLAARTRAVAILPGRRYEPSSRSNTTPGLRKARAVARSGSVESTTWVPAHRPPCRFPPAS